jgi:DNA repair protein RecO (recombination protein O)
LAGSREYQTEAITIKKIKLGEADRILTLYTPEFGKVEAVAKGVRRPKSKMAGHLELLTYSQLRLAHGKNLDTIIGSQTIDSFMELKNDLWSTSYGLYVSELINQFTVSHVPNPSLFQLFLETLRHLAAAENNELTLRYFELHLFDKSGYRPQLQECVSCRSDLKPQINAFCASAGGILCPICKDQYSNHFPISIDALKVLRLFQKSSFEVVKRLKINQDLSREIKGIMENYIRYLLEREVKSAVWLDNLRDNINQYSLITND